MSERRQKAASRDIRSTGEIVAAFRNCNQAELNDATWESVCVLHARGGADELSEATDLCASDRPVLRQIGAAILGQLGWGETFTKEPIDLLIAMLGDTDPVVVSEAVHALGHRRSDRAVGPVLRLIERSEPMIRHGVAFALRHQESPDAANGLVKLSRDKDDDVRNWATFGLAQRNQDTAEIRDALFARLSDDGLEGEICGEALVGLARRSDPAVMEPLISELKGEFRGAWCIEAAGIMARRELYEPLLSLKSRLNEDDVASFGDELDAAIARCSETEEFGSIVPSEAMRLWGDRTSSR